MKKANLICFFCLLYIIKSIYAQEKPLIDFIKISNSDFLMEGKEVSVRARIQAFYGLEDIKKVVLHYRNHKNEHRISIMSLENIINSNQFEYVGIIPQDYVIFGKLRYYIDVFNAHDNLNSSPEIEINVSINTNIYYENAKPDNKINNLSKKASSNTFSAICNVMSIMGLTIGGALFLGTYSQYPSDDEKRLQIKRAGLYSMLGGLGFLVLGQLFKQKSYQLYVRVGTIKELNSKYLFSLNFQY